MPRAAANRQPQHSRAVLQPASRTLPRGLTSREKEIVGLIANGYQHGEIAEFLSISVKTVETHKGNVYNKLGITRAASLIRYALRENLTSP